MPSAAPPIDDRAALDLVMQMMAIPGKSCQEGRVAEFVVEKLREAGVPRSAISFDNAHRRSPRGGEVGNLICKLPGTRRTPRRMLMAHLDTVPLCVGSKPVLRNGVVRSADPATALGADDRAGASVVLNTALTILRSGAPHPPLTFFWPVQEEIGLLGARFADLKKLGPVKLAFNFDGGTVEKATIGATGGYAIAIEIEGVASHAGLAPHEGISAAAIAGLAIADLVENGWHGLVVKGRKRGTSNIGIISGGEATNVVMPKLMLRAEVRSHDPKFRDQIVREFRRAFERAARDMSATACAAADAGKRALAQGTRGGDAETRRRGDAETGVRKDAGFIESSVKGRTPQARVRFETHLNYESFRLADDEPCVVEACRALRAAGVEPMLRVTDGGLDANWLTVRGIPTVTLGCGQQNPHTVNERLDVARFRTACRAAWHLATGE